MKKALILLVITASMAQASATLDRLWATRVNCELQSADAESLKTLTWQQGTTPRLSADQLRSGRAVDAEEGTTAIFVMGASATAGHYVAATNYATIGNGYLINLPTLGTNTASTVGGWWYTIYFERDERRYWTGSGRVNILPTTSTGDGLHWQEITSGAEEDPKFTAWKDENWPPSAGGIGAASAASVEAIETRTNDWNAAYSWGDWNPTYTIATSRLAQVEAKTNDWNAAYAHSTTAHSVTEHGGFQAGANATADRGGAVGYGASTPHGGAVGVYAFAVDGGAVGASSSAFSGGAVGASTHAEGGGAVGNYAYVFSGGAVGYSAFAQDGGAVGDTAFAFSGGAVGSGAKTSDGFAGGKNAQTKDANGDPINAIQFGGGINGLPYSLKLYTNQVTDAHGYVLKERINILTNITVGGSITFGGETRTNWPSGGGGVAGAYVAATNGVAKALEVEDYLQLPQIVMTNLCLRIVASNEYLIVQEVWE